MSDQHHASRHMLQHVQRKQEKTHHRRMSSEFGYHWRIDQIPEEDVAILRSPSHMCIAISKTAIQFVGLMNHIKQESLLLHKDMNPP